jgi:DNA-binding response OmpR family regulator
LAKSDIMVVDDNPANLKLLENMLVQQGHEVRSFPLGRLALAAAVKKPPDLILLDINMPEMNGYEVCERLKASPELARIPVIFLSALDDTEDKLKAFRAGGVDYIAKPFHFEEVHARVETHLGLHQLQQALRLQNERLEETVRARTQELAKAHERLTILDRSKSDFLNLISHEFRTPLNGLLSVGEVILDEMTPARGNDELREIFDQSRQRILSILDDAMLLTQIDVSGDQFRSAPVSLQTVLAQAVRRTAQFARQRRVVLDLPPESADFVLGDENLLVRALHALLETAVKFSGEDEAVRVTRQATAGSLNVIIETRGETIPAAVLPKFFDVFAIGEASTPGRDLGLGPAVAFSILSLFGASVTVANRTPPGIQLTIALAQVAQAKA